MAKQPKKSADAPTNGAGEPNDPDFQNITIQGIRVKVPKLFREGDTLTAATAAELNRIAGENVRNNSAKKIKQAKKQHGENLPQNVLDDLTKDIVAYAESYEFRGKRQARTIDPVEREAKKIAKERILAKLREKDYKVNQMPDGWMDAQITTVLGKYPEIMAEAEKRVRAGQEFGEIVLDLPEPGAGAGASA